jgi:hypothetical protein
MIELGPKYTRDIVPPWPGMSAQDTIIWIRGILVVTQPGDSLYYNVRIGTQQGPVPGIMQTVMSAWQRANQKRVDVVLQRGDEWTIIEVRHIATSAALGRLIQYRDLWAQDRPTDNVRLLLVTDWIDTDLPPLLLATGIDYLII